MIVGAAVVEIHVHESQSLKSKRGVVRSISRRTRNRFNLSVAEVGGQDTWQRSMIGLAAAGSSRQQVRATLERAIAFIEDLHLAEVIHADVELVDLPVEETILDEGLESELATGPPVETGADPEGGDGDPEE
jgi:uncharacterized protein YlxP (DUF503 family)